jgi:hypothetical protein
MKCKAVTQGGKPCKNTAINNTDACYLPAHQTAVADGESGRDKAQPAHTTCVTCSAEIVPNGTYDHAEDGKTRWLWTCRNGHTFQTL